MEGLISKSQQVAEYVSSLLPAATPLPVPQLLNTAAEHVSIFLNSNVPFDLSYKSLPPLTIPITRAIIVTVLAPLIWNVLARLEYYTSILSTICLGKRPGVYLFALWIFGFSLYRDALILEAMRSSPTEAWLGDPIWQALAGCLGIAGMTMVYTSFWRLGITGTYLGDYFGILMKEKEMRFPFNFFNNPMYDGTALLFASKAIMYVESRFLPSPLNRNRFLSV